ncbi:MAG: hypothetical protein M3Q07_09460 [Pseudobdellovibrionaceae bacterium]|nr:hypothetical protein [Pseudobdellovibrionaceae bacterium]
MRLKLGKALCLKALLFLGSTPAWAASIQFPIRIQTPESLTDAQALADHAMIWDGQDWISPALDFSQVTCQPQGEQSFCSGSVLVNADDAPEGKQDRLKLIFDWNGNRLRDKNEPMIPVLKNQAGTLAPHGSVVFLQTDCRCREQADDCMYRESTQISIHEKNTGRMVWGSENHQVLYDASCKVQDGSSSRTAS